jgi:hypothetical protein
MGFLLLVLLLLLFLGGGGLYIGGPVLGGSGVGLILFALLILFLTGRLNFR